MLFFVQNLYAAGGAAQNVGSFVVTLVLISFVMYFFMIRPQQKRANEHKAMLADLKRGDRIITVGGLFGTVQKIDEGNIVLEIGDGVLVCALRSAISSKVDKTGGGQAHGDSSSTPVAAAKPTDGGSAAVSKSARAKKTRKRTR
jgi:preprotein translocase subunit YajC